MRRETLKTNQLKAVALGNFGVFQIYHLTHMGNAHQIMEIGNKIRIEKGLRPITLDSILKKQNFWEFAVSYYNRQMEKELMEYEPDLYRSSESEERYLDPFMQINYSDYKVKGEIKYTELSKKFPKLIQVKRGGEDGGSTYMNIYLLLKLATKLDTDLEVQIFELFIEGKILLHRDIGGVKFKELNRLIDTLPDRIKRAKEKGVSITESNKGVYRDTAKRMNTKINGSFDKGWNDERKDLEKLINREELEKMLCNAIKLKFIINLKTLRTAIENFEF